MGAQRVMRAVNSTRLMKKRRSRFASKYPRLNTVSNVAGRLLGVQSQVKILKGIINSERKYSDILSGSTTIGATGTINALSLLAEGADEGQRDGYSILAKYLRIKMIFTQNAAGTSQNIRCAIVCDTSNAGATPNITDIFQSNTDPTAMAVPANHRRFIILRDFNINLSLNGVETVMFNKLIKLGNLHIRYSGTTGVAANARNNQLYLVLVQRDNTNVTTYSQSTRLAYYDN